MNAWFPKAFPTPEHRPGDTYEDALQFASSGRAMYASEFTP